MRTSIERLLLGAILAVQFPPGTARAASPEAAPATLAAEPQPPIATTRAWRLRLEAQGGVDAPLGAVGGALVLEATPWLALGVGAGAAIGQPQGPYPLVGAFVRANLLRRGPFVLGPVVTVSGGRRARDVVYQRPQFFSADSLQYRWSPGYRVDLGVGAELAGATWSVRLEAGLGLILNDPTCAYQGYQQSFGGIPCDSPSIPEAYHFTFEPGRLAPYVALAIGVAPPPRAPPAASAGGATAPPRTDSAWLAPTALTVPEGSVSATLYELLLARVTYGVTNRIQLSVGTSWSTLLGAPAWSAGAKATLVDVGRFHGALAFEHAGIYIGAWARFVATGGGPVLSVCVDAGCDSVISVSAMAGALHAQHDEGPDTTTVDTLVSPSAVGRLSKWVKVALEAHVPWTSPRDGFWAAVLRVPLDHVTLDLGALGALSNVVDVVPAASVGYRW